jgi:hypothetical protein
MSGFGFLEGVDNREKIDRIEYINVETFNYEGKGINAYK